MEEVSILQDGRVCGSLRVEREGLYVAYQAVCRAGDEETPLRLVAVGEAGEVRLGIPAPEGKMLALRRRLSAREAAAAGHLLRGELREMEPRTAWQAVPAPEQLFRDGTLRQQLRGAEGVLTRQEEGVRFLALPFDCRRPFLLTGLFCFARVRRIEGREYAVFCFDRSDNPVFR